MCGVSSERLWQGRVWPVQLCDVERFAAYKQPWLYLAAYVRMALGPKAYRCVYSVESGHVVARPRAEWAVCDVH